MPSYLVSVRCDFRLERVPHEKLQRKINVRTPESFLAGDLVGSYKSVRVLVGVQVVDRVSKVRHREPEMAYRLCDAG